MLIGVVDRQNRVPSGRAVVGSVRRFAFGPGLMVRMIVVLEVTVLVVTDVEVDVEETGAELTVVVPVSSGVEAEAGEAGQGDEDQRRHCRPRRSGRGSAESS